MKYYKRLGEEDKRLSKEIRVSGVKRRRTSSARDEVKLEGIIIEEHNIKWGSLLPTTNGLSCRG